MSCTLLRVYTALNNKNKKYTKCQQTYITLVYTTSDDDEKNYFG